MAYVVAAFPEVACELNNKDSILGAKGNEQHNANLGVYAHRYAGDYAAKYCAQQGDGYTHYGSNGACPALILCSKHKECHKQCKCKDNNGVLPRSILLEGHACPLISELIAKLCPEQLCNLFHHLARAVALCCVGGDGGAVVHVVTHKLVVA